MGDRRKKINLREGKKVQSVIHDMSNKCYTLGYPIPMLISLLILSLPIKLSSFYDKHDEHWHFRNCCTIGTEKNKK